MGPPNPRFSSAPVPLHVPYPLLWALSFPAPCIHPQTLAHTSNLSLKGASSVEPSLIPPGSLRHACTLPFCCISYIPPSLRYCSCFFSHMAVFFPPYVSVSNACYDAWHTLDAQETVTRQGGKGWGTGKWHEIGKEWWERGKDGRQDGRKQREDQNGQ